MADLYSILADGRPKSYVDDMDPRFSAALAKMLDNAPPDIQNQFRIFSGARSNERQAELYAAALKKYGSPERARKWVAPPGRSMHNKGVASDLTYLNPAAKKWAHENAQKYGLNFPMSHEPWHIELAGVRGNKVEKPRGLEVLVAKDQPNPLVATSDVQPRQMVATPPQPILGADARQAAVQQQQQIVQQPQAPAIAQNPSQSPIGNMLSGLMGSFSPAMSAQMPVGPRVTQDDSAAIANAAAQLSEKGKQLKSAFLPNVDEILGLSKLGGTVI